ncbi:indole-3-glycerol-phosphate synthase [Candidatus Bathyarchaeota archaeon]|nr:MAG: indole-3-glycerol-phosphate synthase [Candidatus Bathyarchaeota archaeon]
MVDHLMMLAREAERRVENGYYENPPRVSHPKRSLRTAVRDCSTKNPVIAELKYASPSEGQIRSFDCPTRVADEILDGGPCALSVLTAPDSFQGTLVNLSDVAVRVDVPVLMKDIIVSPEQIRAGARAGADAVVLIAELFERGLAKTTMLEMITEAKRLGLEVLAEACSAENFIELKMLEPDLYGINNRDLSSLRVNLETTEEILSRKDRPTGLIVAESGIETSLDVRRLRAAGADAFLVGTAIMKADNVKEKVRELVEA